MPRGTTHRPYPPEYRAEAVRLVREGGRTPRELATDLARLPNTQAWSGDDLRIMANLVVTAMVSTAEAIILAPPNRPDVEREIVRTAVTQLRMIVVGAANWRSR